METSSVAQPSTSEFPVKPIETLKHAFCFSHLSGVKMEQDVANGKEVLQMSHLILELSDRIKSYYILMPSCDNLLPTGDPP